MFVSAQIAGRDGVKLGDVTPGPLSGPGTGGPQGQSDGGPQDPRNGKGQERLVVHAGDEDGKEGQSDTSSEGVRVLRGAPERPPYQDHEDQPRQQRLDAQFVTDLENRVVDGEGTLLSRRIQH